MRALILTLVVLSGGLAAAQAAETPAAVASTSGSGVANVSASGADRWHVVVTTKPPGLRVRVEVAGRRDRVGKSPVRLDYACGNCTTRVAARLWPRAGKRVPPAATVKVSLYRR